MSRTIVYLVRHSEQLKNKANKLNVSESEQISNEKIILTVNGEKEAERISKLDELKNINVLCTSNYVRAISTAKYIAYENNIELNIDENFNERKLGNLETLKELGKTRMNKYTTEQLLDKELSNTDGESRKETEERFFKSFEKLIKDNQGKKIVIVSHGAIIKFALLRWCTLNSSTNVIEYNGNELAQENLNSSEIFKLEFKNQEVVNISLIRKN